ncbi:hypothetical protein [uncultured Traorella sp.]|uniref:hypothetical protein n=1 Tax=uncultured Traorella sp. TaxID=1929048 RepID=UPI0025F81F7F|nr:hypothetical protein [uncultured Traorella sp.]
MKKMTAYLLGLALMISMTACSSADSDDSGENNDNTPVETEEISFEEITVVDNEQCTIKITGIEPDNMWGYTLNAYLENKSEDKTYMFSVQNASVNGLQTDPLFATTVAAGKKSNEEINFSEDLSSYGLTDFTDIQLTFRVYDNDDWMADDVALQTVHVYPYGEDKATTFVRESQSTDHVIVDNENVTIIVTGYDEDGIWGYTMHLYLVNKTDSEVMFSVDDVSVNGFMADPFWAASVAAGKAAFSDVSWSDSTFEENDITTVEEIEMTWSVYNNEDWTQDDIYNETVVLNP